MGALEIYTPEQRHGAQHWYTGRQYPETKAGGALAWEDVGTSDVRLNVTNSAATSSGEVRLTVLYQQNTNYS